MVSSSVIISGYKLEFNDILESDELHKLCSLYKNTHPDAKLIRVRRYPGLENEDNVGTYVAWDFYLLPFTDPLNCKKTIQVIGTMPEPVPECFIPIIKELKGTIGAFNIYVDWCDCYCAVEILF